MSDLNLDIHLDVASVAWKNAFPKMRVKIKQAATRAFLDAKKPASFKGRTFEINILLTTDATIRKLNKIYRGKDTPTNVLSFPQFEITNKRRPVDLKIFPAKTAIPLGDIVLAYKTIVQESKDQKKTIENHVVHLIVHGTLHLLGYDHMIEKEAKIMEKLECDILAVLGYPDPYHEYDARHRGR